MQQPVGKTFAARNLPGTIFSEAAGQSLQPCVEFDIASCRRLPNIGLGSSRRESCDLQGFAIKPSGTVSRCWSICWPILHLPHIETPCPP